MKKLLLLSILFISCSFNPEVTPITKSHLKSLSIDYTANLFDEWAANRGIILSSPTVFAKLKGRVNKRYLTTTTLAIPANGVIPTTGTNGFSYAATSSNGITGDASFVFLINKSAVATANEIIFDSNTNSPRLQCFVRNSTSKIGISYNGVSYSSTTSFPIDTLFHTLIYSINGVSNTAQIFLDGTSISTFSITGGGLNANTGQTLGVLKSIMAGTFFKGKTKKIRFYSGVINDSLATVINSGDFINDIASPDAVIAIEAGQSNNGPILSYNVLSSYPSELQSIDSAYFWNSPTESIFNPIDNPPTYVSTYPGPFLKMAYTLKQDNPGKEVYIIEKYVVNTNLAVDWASGSTNRNQLINRIKIAIATLKAECHNINSIRILWVQGEKDSQDINYSNAYYDNLVGLMTEIRGATDINIKVVISYLSSQTIFTYKTTVRSAQESFVAIDTINNFGINTDDPSNYPLYTDKTHYLITGLINVGYEAAKK